MNDQTIRNFLTDGESTGILLVDISHWTGTVLVVPRSQLDQLSNGVLACLGTTRDSLQSQLLPGRRVVS